MDVAMLYGLEMGKGTLGALLEPVRLTAAGRLYLQRCLRASALLCSHPSRSQL